MSKVLAAVMPAPNKPVTLQEFPEPELKPGAALMRVELSEVCGTDVHLQHGRLEGATYPMVPGHVSVGRLEKIRGRITDVRGRVFREGDRITFLDVHKTCNRCWHCLVAKATTRCPARKVYGITYGAADGLTGGWAEKIHLMPETRCLRLDGVDGEAFMAGGCSLPTALHAMERADVSVGDTVLVLGSGPVGLSTVILSRLRGALRTLCVGAPEGRLRTALEVGASDVCSIVDCGEDERRQWVLDRTDGRGADVVIEASGDPRAVVQAMRWARDAGRVVVVGQYTDHGEVPFNPHLDLNRKHLEVRGCWGSDFSHFHRAVELMSRPELSAPWAKIELSRFGLAEAQQAIDRVAAGRVVKALIVPGLKREASR